MKTNRNVLISGMAVLASACGGGGASSSGSAHHVDNAHAAHTAGGEVIHTAGTGQAVAQSAHQRFEEAARMMHDHDEANNGQGDWTNDICGDIADRFQTAANEQPGGAFAEAWFDRGMAFERCSQTDHARDAFQHAIQVSQNHVYCRAQVQLGVYMYRAGQRGDAMSAFQQSVHDDPNCVEGYTNLAMLQRETGQAADRVTAVGNIRQALARDDKYIPALHQLALTYLQEAGDDAHSQRLMLAAIVCAQAVQVAAQHTADIAADIRGYVADVYNTWGLIDIRSGQIIHALDHFRRAFTLNPRMFEAWVNYGTINLSFRGYEDARDAFDHAVHLRDGDYDAHIGLGIALRGLGQIPPAQAEYQRAQQIDANRPDVYYNLGVLNEGYMGGEIADLQHAIDFLTQFVGKAGATPRYADAVHRAQQHIHNDRLAIQALQAAAALNAQAPAGANNGSPAPAGGASPAPAGGASPTPASSTGGGASPAPATSSAPAAGAAH